MIDFKSLAIAYAIGIIVFLIGGTAFVLSGSPAVYLGVLVLMMLPMGFYFHRNETAAREAFILCMAFGMTFLPAYFVALGLPLLVIQSIFVGPPDLGSSLGYIDFGQAAQELIVSGLVLSVPSYLSYFVVRYIRKPPHPLKT
jgi:hypothetical protein